jgi:hypothetical protein
MELNLPLPGNARTMVVDTFELFSDKDAKEVDALVRARDQHFDAMLQELLHLALIEAPSVLGVPSFADASPAALETEKDKRGMVELLDLRGLSQQEAERLIQYDKTLKWRVAWVARELSRHFPETRRWRWQEVFIAIVREWKARDSLMLKQAHKGPEGKRPRSERLTPKQQERKRLAEDRIKHGSMSEREYARKNGIERSKLRRTMKFYKQWREEERAS